MSQSNNLGIGGVDRVHREFARANYEYCGYQKTVSPHFEHVALPPRSA
jgi:hypothetical protein